MSEAKKSPKLLISAKALKLPQNSGEGAERVIVRQQEREREKELPLVLI